MLVNGISMIHRMSASLSRQQQPDGDEPLTFCSAFASDFATVLTTRSSQPRHQQVLQSSILT